MSEHLELLARGVEAWNLWRAGNPLVRPNFNFAPLRERQLADAHLRDAIFDVADLERADLGRCVLVGASLVGAVLRGADLRRASLTDANLFQANLSQADLGGADLRAARLDQANLRGADLREADLRGATLRAADLEGANLAGADLGRAIFTDASLLDANLAGANLVGADLSTANLDNADFSAARFGWTRLADLDLSVARGLESARHLGPSSVGMDTIFRCGTKVPENFLQGLGIPDIFLTYMASLLGQAFEYFSCAVRSSPADGRFAERLFADLRAKGVRTWYRPDEGDAEPERGFEIDRSIKVFDRLVLVCSEASLKSERILMDLEQALDREEDRGSTIVFAVRIDDYVLDGWQHERKAALLDRPIPDFADWEHSADRYDSALTELLDRLAPALKQQRRRR
jgi:uncharacterized protein YjbI with pentapeptide repeats